MHPNYRGMAFLLSLGSLPLGGCGDDEEQTSGLSTLGPITTQSDNGGDSAATSGTGTTAVDDPTTNDTTTDADLTTGPGPTTNSTMTAPMTGDPATGEPEDPTNASEPQMTTFVTGNTDDTGFPGETEFPETGGYGGRICGPYADKIAECFQRNPAMVLEYCEYSIGMGGRADGPACAQAFEAFFACVSQLDCGSIEMSTGCEGEDMGVTRSCPSLGGP